MDDNAEAGVIDRGQLRIWYHRLQQYHPSLGIAPDPYLLGLFILAEVDEQHPAFDAFDEIIHL